MHSFSNWARPVLYNSQMTLLLVTGNPAIMLRDDIANRIKSSHYYSLTNDDVSLHNCIRGFLDDCKNEHQQ